MCHSMDAIPKRKVNPSLLLSEFSALPGKKSLIQLEIAPAKMLREYQLLGRQSILVFYCLLSSP